MGCLKRHILITGMLYSIRGAAIMIVVQKGTGEKPMQSPSLHF
jgi:hypothetical protein